MKTIRSRPIAKVIEIINTFLRDFDPVKEFNKIADTLGLIDRFFIICGRLWQRSRGDRIPKNGLQRARSSTGRRALIQS